MRHQDDAAARQAIERALTADPKHAEALWLKARLALREGNHILASGTANELVAAGRDGYEVQVLVAKAAELAHDDRGQATALERAHAFDPFQSDALYGLLDLARKRSDTQAAEKWLRALYELEEHQGSVYRDLMDLLVKTGRAKEAVEFGLSAVYADMESVSAHVSYAEALAAAGNPREAQFEFESATLCPAEAPERARAHLQFARFLQRQGRTASAKRELATAQALDASLAKETL